MNEILSNHRASSDEKIATCEHEHPRELTREEIDSVSGGFGPEYVSVSYPSGGVIMIEAVRNPFYAW
jgi:hypothetical protein